MLDLTDGKREFPWSFDYVVGKPTGAISSPEYSIFYGKYKNLIKASVSGSSSTDVRVSCPACKSVVKKGENYEIEARTGSEVEVIVSSNSTTIKRK